MKTRTEQEMFFQALAYKANLSIMSEPDMDIAILEAWINVMDINEVKSNED